MPRPGNGAIAWHALGLPAIFSLLVANPSSGLTNKAAEDRRSLQGTAAPRIPRPKPVFLGRVQTGITVILSFLAVVTAFLRLWADCLTLVALLLLNLLPSRFSNRRTKAAAAALRTLRRRRVLTLRDAHLQELSLSKLVPGDIIIVVAGDIVPADARLLSARSLWCTAHPLCWGHFPLSKTPGVLAAETPLRRRANMLHMGTRVVHGSGRAIVVATGSATTIFLSAKSNRLHRRPSRTSLGIDPQGPPLPTASKR